MLSGSQSTETRLDAVIFDFDGVIVESVDIKTEAFRTLFADEPESLDAIVALHRRHAGTDRLVKFEMIHRDILHRPLDAERKAALAARFQELVFEHVIACPMVSGAMELIAELHARLPLAIVSGTPEPELREIVSRRGLQGYFDAVHGSPRSKIEIIRDLLESHGWSSGRTVMVGDARADLEAAQANGLGFIGCLASGLANPFPSDTAVANNLFGVKLLLASQPSWAG